MNLCHLGSIIAITNSDGEVIEKTHYGAWGEVAEYWDAKGNDTLGYTSILGRGYTGHEHFNSVSLIHMNGRMYDAKLRRFLSPDNFIQDPFNTQSFNRYGYVWNNPLKYIDPSGEFLVAAMIIGAVVGAYIGGAKANGGNWNPFKWDYSSGATWAGIGIGAVVGAIGGEVVGAGILGVKAFGIFTVKLGVTVAVPGLGSIGLSKLGDKLSSEYTNPQGETYSQEIATIPGQSPTKPDNNRNDPPDQEPTVDADEVINTKVDYWRNFNTASKLFLEWVTGKGDVKRSFYNDSVANAFRDAYRVNQARDYWYQQVELGRNVVDDPVTGFKGTFGPIGAFRAGNDPIEQFVGGFRINSITVQGDNLRFELSNRTSMNSFLYDIGPSWSRDTFSLSGNTYQTYIFTEKIDYERINNR